MPKFAVGDNAGVVEAEGDDEETDKVAGSERKSVAEEGGWSTSIGSDIWRVNLGVVSGPPP